MEIKRRNQLKKRIVWSVCFIILSLSNILLNSNMSKAKSNTNYDDVVNRFTHNSTEYQQIKLELQKYLNTKSEYENSVEKYKKRIDQVPNDSETLENLTSEYENSLLQLKIYSFYELYGDKWLEEKLRNIKYNFLCDYLQLPLLQIRIFYYDALLIECNDTLKITQALYHSGYATKLEVEKVKTQIVNTKANKKLAEDEFDYLKLKVEIQLNDSDISTFSLNKIKAINMPEEYKKSYLNNNVTLQYLQTQVEAYQIYKANMESKGENYKKYVNKSDIELQLLDLKHQEYNLQELLSIKKTYSSFQSQTLLLESKDWEIEYGKSKMKEKQLLYKKGKAKKIEITQLKTELAKLNYERENILYQQNIAYYALFYDIVLN